MDDTGFYNIRFKDEESKASHQRNHYEDVGENRDVKRKLR